VKILEIDYHRNGVCGEGFYAVRFRDVVDDAPEPREFLAMVFSKQVYGVVCVEMLPELGVGMGNHWRGDHYIDRLWRGIKAWQRAQLVRATTGGVGKEGGHKA
jgi:hypothetical protein